MSPPDGVEDDALPGRALALTAVVVLGVMALAVWWSVRLDGAGARQIGPPPARAAGAAIEPGLIWLNASQAGLAAQRADLHRFRWVDRARGIVAIPIERAIELVAEPSR